MVPEVVAVIAPSEETEKFVPFTTVVPVFVPSVSVPVPFCSSVRPVLRITGLITGFAPEKVRTVLVKVLPL